MDAGILTFTNNNHANCTIRSKIPKKACDEPCCLGIDEAGRGPVLGPMVYGTSFCTVAAIEDLTAMGFADSKTLTEEQREGLLEKIEASDIIGWVVEVLSPNYLSNAMLRRHKYNLNAISHDTAIGLIQGVIDSGVNLKEVYVDTVGPPDKYQDKLKGIFPDLNITVAKKADSLYPIVSAASICAKVARDWAVQRWKFEEGVVEADTAYGSGYPGDPKTKKFMADTLDPVCGFPQFVRFSWSTAGTIMQNKAFGVSWEDQEDDDNDKGTPAITCFFMDNKSSFKTNELPEAQFFKDNCLQLASEF